MFVLEAMCVSFALGQGRGLLPFNFIVLFVTIVG